MILRIAAALALIAGVASLYFAGSKNYFEIEESKTVLFSAESIYDQINDLSRWKKWSSYLKKEGTSIDVVDNLVGKRSILRWNNLESSGQFEIVDTIKNQEVTVQASFDRPFKQEWIFQYQIKSLDENKIELKILCRGSLDLTTKIMHRLLNIPKLLSEQLSQEIDEIQIQLKNK